MERSATTLPVWGKRPRRISPTTLFAAPPASQTRARDRGTGKVGCSQAVPLSKTSPGPPPIPEVLEP
eukprot:6970707-Alexandrium_andersonii.AAC.1